MADSSPTPEPPTAAYRRIRLLLRDCSTTELQSLKAVDIPAAQRQRVIRQRETADALAPTE